MTKEPESANPTRSATYRDFKAEKHQPVSFLFWRTQSQLAKTNLKLAKIHERLEALEKKLGKSN